MYAVQIICQSYNACLATPIQEGDAALCANIRIVLPMVETTETPFT
jgi:hypothetical protein